MLVALLESIMEASFRMLILSFVTVSTFAAAIIDWVSSLLVSPDEDSGHCCFTAVSQLIDSICQSFNQVLRSKSYLLSVDSAKIKFRLLLI